MRILLKESIISIKRNLKRFLSILLIVLLGVGFFAGIRVTSPDMEKTMSTYYNETNFMDFNLISTWGITKDEVKTLKSNNYIVEPSYEFDAIVKTEIEEVIKIISYDKDSTINNVVLLNGRLPNNKHECLIEQSEYTESHKIGDKITVENDTLKDKDLTIVGIIKSPIYTSIERGTTTLLSGKIKFFMYVPIENFDIDYYTNLYVKLDSNGDRDVFSNKYKTLLNKEEQNLKNITDSLIEERYNTEKTKALRKIKEQEEKLDSEKEKYNNKIKEARNKIVSSNKQYINNLEKLNKEIKNAEAKFLKASNAIAFAKDELDKNKKVLLEREQELNKKIEENASIIKELNDNYRVLNNNITTMNKEIESLIIEKEQLELLVSQGINVEQNLNTVIEKIAYLEEEKQILGANIKEVSLLLNQINSEIDTASKMLTDSKYELQQASLEIENNEKILNDSKDTFNIEITSSKKQLEQARVLINSSEKELALQKVSAEKKFREVEEKIRNAKEDVENLEMPEWYVLNNENNIGFYQYSQDTERIEKIGKIFPLVFFVVAILICLTSMTRMVEEERNQLGTLKALGYSNLQIISKYIIYALLATVIGSILGVLIGMRILPTVIINMYSMMYTVGDPVLSFDIKYALTGTMLAMICILVATLFACYKELHTQPATLMRPKSPKAGKRVLLERIKFIWSRLSFTKKVTVRNVFRYKKRFLMTIIGIAGCTGLIIAGFGLRDCITSMAPMQYSDIFNYQLEVTYKDDILLEVKNNESERISKIDKVNNVLKVNKESVTIENKETNQSVQLIVPFSDMDGFISLRDRKTNDTFKLDNDGIVTEKLSRLLDLEIGDELIIKTDKKYSFKVGNITENYFNHFVYIDKNIYNSNNYNTLLIKTHALTEKEEKDLAEEIKKNDLVANISYTSSMKSLFDSTMENFGLVAIVLIVSAGLLAFVVLYNLASVNMSERKRELATIKVLGFYDKEVYNYIGRETTILTIIGMAFGVVVGKILTIYILKTCELDSIMFNTKISLTSYIYSLLITLIFTLLVNITTYFSLKKIDMIESLKSIE